MSDQTDAAEQLPTRPGKREKVLDAAATCAAAAQRLQHRADLDDESRALVDVIVEAAIDIKGVVAEDNIDPITDLR